MKICCVIPSLQPGGMERVMSVLANGFVNQYDAEVHLILFGKNRGIFYDVDPKIIIHKPCFPFDDSKRNWMAIKTLFFLRKEIKAIHPDSILSFGEGWNNMVLLATLGLKYPIYVSDRCRPTKSFGFIRTILRRHLYPLATGVIAQTTKAKECYDSQFHQNNIPVIGNPINQVIIPQNIEREDIVVSVGRLIDTKNYDQLIDVFAKINYPDWKLIIVGGDALKQNNSLTLQKQIDDLDLKERIILAGTQKNVNSYLFRSKIFAFTSSSEGFPNVIGEAMSAGLPVVSYDCITGPSEMIEDGKSGFLVPLFDKKAFEEKLKYLMDNPDKIITMGEYAKRSISKYSSTNITSQFYEVLSNHN